MLPRPPSSTLFPYTTLFRSVCQEIRKQLTVPIIFLTVRRDTIDKVKCFEYGGDDYVTKPFEFEELHARIKANIRRYYTYPKEDRDILDRKSTRLNSSHVAIS